MWGVGSGNNCISLQQEASVGTCATLYPHLCSLKEFGPYLWVVSFSKFLGKLMIMMASKGHFCICIIVKDTPGLVNSALECNVDKCLSLTFTQIPQPIQSSSDIQAIFEVGVTSTHCFPAGYTSASCCCAVLC